jgi:hypothetical protein
MQSSIFADIVAHDAHPSGCAALWWREAHTSLWPRDELSEETV